MMEHFNLTMEQLHDKIYLGDPSYNYYFEILRSQTKTEMTI